MRKIIIVALAVVASASFNVATAAKKKQKKEANTTTVVPVELKTSSDTLSYVGGMSMTEGLMPYLLQEGLDTAQMAEFYRGFDEIIDKGNNPKVKAYAIGMSVATQLKDRMVTRMKADFTDTPDSVVEAVLYRGFKDAVNNDTTVFKTKDATAKFRTMSEANKEAKQEKLYGANREAGRKFLAENAQKDSVVTLPSGLQYKVLVQGNGEVPQKKDKVKVNYEGRLIDGTVFDASSKHGLTPATFRADQVIKGWTEALTMMPVGSKWQLFIPYELAYGDRSAGKEIKPFSALIFDIELVDIDRPKTEEPAKDKEYTAKVKKDKKANMKTSKK